LKVIAQKPLCLHTDDRLITQYSSNLFAVVWTNSIPLLYLRKYCSLAWV